jgi:NAD(P)H-hydrate epimerase
MNRIKNIPALPARPVDSHKGTYGRVMVIGGSVGMAGAPSLVANAALRSGAGLVTIAIPEPILDVVAGLAPCATTIPLPANKTGQIKPIAALKLLRQRGWAGDKKAANPPDVLVIGPGLGAGSHDYAENVWSLIDAFRVESGVPTVVDADAINLAALLPDGWDRRSHPRTVFTPHPGELARLLGTTTRDIQSNREPIAIEAAHRLNHASAPSSDESNTTGDLPAGAVLVLKGAGTIVTDGASIYANRTGNPGMATGGSGDVLSGVIGALLGQGLSCLDAATLGVYVHGLAGDLAAARMGQISLIATDITSALPDAFLQTGSRRPRAKSGNRVSKRKKSR